MTAQSQLSTIGSSLTSALPAFLTQSQQLEQAHATFLKERLVLAGTATNDLGRETMEAGEKLLNSVLGVDEQVEMQTWALRESMNAGGQAGGAGAPTGLQANSNIPSEFGTTSLREDSIMEEPTVETAPPPQERRAAPREHAVSRIQSHSV